ncbi:DUF4139 domain-containing protein [Streptomyces sp. NPDC005423]|uniref:DUF4139 domain-containing protein n=1 Tax=Streptomyces sp. NPDC005423 TaxID=3155343 RepID=UPI0033B3ABF1
MDEATARKTGTEPEWCAESVLESVVVHSVGALCTRRVRCALPAHRPPADDGHPGALRLRVEGLPVTLYEHSLRARIRSGPPGLRITDVRAARAAEVAPDAELPRLRVDLTEAEDRAGELRDQCEQLQTDIEELAGLRATAPQTRRGDPPRRTPVESLLALAGFLDSRLAMLHERLRTAEDELRRAEHETDVLARRLEQSSTAEPAARVRESTTALLTIDLGAPGRQAPDAPADSGTGSELGSEPGAGTGPGTAPEIDVEIEYHVPGATWSPVYQLRLNNTGTRAEGVLLLRAGVAQRTGEDWTGVRLGLSTADLLRGVDIPQLRSLRIGRRQTEPAPSGGWREPPSGLAELFAGYDAAAAARPVSGLPLAGSAPQEAPKPRSPHRARARSAGMEFGASVPMAGGYAPVAGGVPPAAPMAASAPSGPAPASPPPPPPTPAPPVPGEELLDYARLVLAGPEEPARRGKLGRENAEPDLVVAEYRRRAAVLAPAEHDARAAGTPPTDGSFAHRFDTAAPVDVEADGARHTVAVCEIPVGLATEYVCVPVEDQLVYGTVVLTNTSVYPLLAGPADVTVDGEFVLTAPLPALAPGQRRRVGIGVVESVRVARRGRLRESTAGLRSGTTVLDHTVEVELANRLGHLVVVEVRERIPVTTEKDVHIEEHPAHPPWTAPAEPDEDSGRYVEGARIWRVELEPGRTVTLKGGHTIRVPAGKALVGGNRRDVSAP